MHAGDGFGGLLDGGGKKSDRPDMRWGIEGIEGRETQVAV